MSSNHPGKESSHRPSVAPSVSGSSAPPLSPSQYPSQYPSPSRRMSVIQEASVRPSSSPRPQASTRPSVMQSSRPSIAPVGSSRMPSMSPSQITIPASVLPGRYDANPSYGTSVAPPYDPNMISSSSSSSSMATTRPPSSSNYAPPSVRSVRPSTMSTVRPNSGTILQRDQATTMPSVQGTTLRRDMGTMLRSNQGTTLQRDSKATIRPSVRPSALQLTLSTHRPTSFAPSVVNSFLTRPEDQIRAASQLSYANMTTLQRDNQTSWAHQLIAKAIKCPEGYEWERRENPGGYQCGGKGHGTTDTLLAEGKGGLVTLLGKRNWDNPKDFEAVYYPKPGCPGQFLPAVEPFREPAGQ